MISQSEIQRVHDILSEVVLGKVPIGFESDESEAACEAALNVLCWILGHDSGAMFSRNIEAIEAAAKAKGYGLIDAGRVMPFEEIEKLRNRRSRDH